MLFAGTLAEKSDADGDTDTGLWPVRTQARDWGTQASAASKTGWALIRSNDEKKLSLVISGYQANPTSVECNKNASSNG